MVSRVCSRRHLPDAVRCTQREQQQTEDLAVSIHIRVEPVRVEQIRGAGKERGMKVHDGRIRSQEVSTDASEISLAPAQTDPRSGCSRMHDISSDRRWRHSDQAHTPDIHQKVRDGVEIRARLSCAEDATIPVVADIVRAQQLNDPIGLVGEHQVQPVNGIRGGVATPPCVHDGWRIHRIDLLEDSLELVGPRQRVVGDRVPQRDDGLAGEERKPSAGSSDPSVFEEQTCGRSHLVIDQCTLRPNIFRGQSQRGRDGPLDV
ncbi:hypothetical protein ASG45_12280 [Microbacterium sp. Leaf436]|nr:hypothetical protein ASG45_12280 [Microbacterium sp. Leaf436]